MTEIINAFHPDYIKTHHPEMLSSMRIASAQHAAGVVNGGKSRATRESVHGRSVNTIDAFPKTKPKRAKSSALLSVKKSFVINAAKVK